MSNADTGSRQAHLTGHKHKVTVRKGGCFARLTIDLCNLHIRRGQVILLTEHLCSLIGIYKVKQKNNNILYVDYK